MIRASFDHRLSGFAPLRLRAHLLVFMMAVLLPALLAGGATAWQLGRVYREAAETGLHGAVRAMAAAADRELDVAVAAASTLAGSRALRALAAGGSPAEGDGALADLYARARGLGDAFGGWAVLVRSDGSQIF